MLKNKSNPYQVNQGDNTATLNTRLSLPTQPTITSQNQRNINKHEIAVAKVS